MKTIVIAKTSSTSEWWESLTKEQQDEYIELHPNSKYAKQFKAKVEPKIKKDPYKDVPKKDRQLMLQAKERGFTVPPAWREVWLNPDPKGDLQVKGKDSKGRTQYLYSVNYRTQQDSLKFNRLKTFTLEYPKISKKISDDFNESEEAKVLYLISKTGFRIGDDKDTGARVRAYGASTLTSDHIKVEGSKIHFDFIGKEGVRQQHTLTDKKLAQVLIEKKGRLFDTSSEKIRKYLKSLSKNSFKVKDFRTFVATSTALQAIKKMDTPKDKKQATRAINEVCKLVSIKLGNTPIMAKNSYIDPTVFKDWESIGVETSGVAMAGTKTEYQNMLDYVETHHYKVDGFLIIWYRKYKKETSTDKKLLFLRKIQTRAEKLNIIHSGTKAEKIKTMKTLLTILDKELV